MASCRAGAEETEGAPGQIWCVSSCSGGQTQTCSKPAGRGDQEALQSWSRLPVPGSLPAE